MEGQDVGIRQAEMARFELEIPIEAPPEQVWKALVEEASFWWREDFYATPAPHRFVIEPVLGGRVYEDAGEGNGVLWYTVQGIMQGQFINLSGFFFPPFGGPVTELLRLVLEPDGNGGTLFRVQDALVGAASAAADVQKGWTMLFAELKKHAEARTTV